MFVCTVGPTWYLIWPTEITQVLKVGGLFYSVVANHRQPNPYIIGGGAVMILLCPTPPPLSVGTGLGNRATHLRDRTRFQSSRLGFLCDSWHLPCYFSSRFRCSFFAFPCIFPAPPRRGWHGDDSPKRILPAPQGWVFLFFTYFAGFVALPFRGVGVGFEEPHLRLMF